MCARSEWDMESRLSSSQAHRSIRGRPGIRRRAAAPPRPGPAGALLEREMRQHCAWKSAFAIAQDGSGERQVFFR
ncbi:hypothetical protein SCE1572_22255 [Sorangium cellulosum So0157-2]|uniref:Uncharacterized protein n=1 Tax=Sorangium cellulosum So0157-2 TaxID=1254432 RepID=S4Y287_SORCE|nr:hypothetical protein SCE1572_22255 [Sorangium cellulosum So0157-2]